MDLLPYTPAPVALRPWSPDFPAAAAALCRAVEAVCPELTAEHIGSSAVAGLAGKGYLDLQAEVVPGRMATVTEALVKAGWQRQTEPWAFPPTRPMLRAAIRVMGRSVNVHLHLIPRGSPELAANRAFRDALRADAELREEYVARKRAVLAAGITLGPAYAAAKGSFVQQVLARRGFPVD